MNYNPSAKEFRDLFKQAEARAKAMMESVALEYAVQYQERVKSDAPSEQILPGYKEAIVSAQIEGSIDSAVVVKDFRQSETIGSKNKDFSLIYVVTDLDPPSPLFVLLDKYAPFAVDMFPVKSLPEDIRLEYRMVRAGEVRSIKNKNQQNDASVRAGLSSLGVTPGPLPPETEVKEDMVFKIMRAEAGLNPNIAPHWRTNLLSLKRQFNVGVNIADILSNPKYTGYKSLDKSENTISESEASDLEAFQKSLR